MDIQQIIQEVKEKYQLNKEQQQDLAKGFYNDLIKAEGSKEIRTALHNEKLSLWHRQNLGRNCPMLDLDFVAIEYNNNVPAAIIEYKHINGKYGCSGRMPDNYQILADLATASGLPFLEISYNDDLSEWFIWAFNDIARKMMYGKPYLLTSEEFKEWHKNLRKL